MAHIQVMEGNFCRVVGSIRQTQDRRHVMAFRVANLTTANEITTHLLETQWVRMKLRQMKKKMVSETCLCDWAKITFFSVGSRGINEQCIDSEWWNDRAFSLFQSSYCKWHPIRAVKLSDNGLHYYSGSTFFSCRNRVVYYGLLNNSRLRRLKLAWKSLRSTTLSREN